MNFDTAFEEYLDIRNKLREQQGAIDKKRNEILSLGRELENMKGKYNATRRQLVKAQDSLIPVLRKEVASFPLPDEDRSAYEEGTRNVLKRTPEQEAQALDRAVPPAGDEAVEVSENSQQAVVVEKPAEVEPEVPTP
jgi:hypothetical protein